MRRWSAARLSISLSHSHTHIHTHTYTHTHTHTHTHTYCLSFPPSLFPSVSLAGAVMGWGAAGTGLASMVFCPPRLSLPCPFLSLSCLAAKNQRKEGPRMCFQLAFRMIQGLRIVLASMVRPPPWSLSCLPAIVGQFTVCDDVCSPAIASYCTVHPITLRDGVGRDRRGPRVDGSKSRALPPP